MRLTDPSLLAALAKLQVELQPAVALSSLTSLRIGGTTDLLRIHRNGYVGRCSTPEGSAQSIAAATRSSLGGGGFSPRVEATNREGLQPLKATESANISDSHPYNSLPALLNFLDSRKIPHKFLGGGSNLLVADGELPFVVLQLVAADAEVVIEGNLAHVDAAADLGRTVTFCAKHDLGGMEGLIGVPGTVGGALRMNAGAYGTQIGSYVREVKLYRAATRAIEIVRGNQISFEYRHTSFAADDMMLAVILELPSKTFQEILKGIRICNEKRRSSQPLGQKSAGCIFKNPPGASAGRMIDELGLKGFSVGDARVSDRHANFFVNTGNATARDMLTLISDVRDRVEKNFGVKLENEVVVWNA
jgi:UDP-N-acetylmuramate dehydrogenase